MEEKFYRHIGVYGICMVNEKILVIRKSLGPYAGQFDLPGGRLEVSESLVQGLKREFNEETGFKVKELNNIGVCDFSVLWTLQDNSTECVHHIAILYEVIIVAGKIGGSVVQFEGQDSNGYDWISIDDVTPINSSPLVQQAADWFRTKTIPVSRSSFDYRSLS
ncbi:ADP-ribose pyrophosphatase YjhB, NUDIX family [Paenibacillus catalpae]|uniref:ADP-ribose pyrophosphatase YjhB, NUDIX family n=1 Tax=Paenibacillus catalpae TaxID=1045775 RepID=A0A1I2ET64_9BACL|nr:NUDIX hydrolase [Paenibacillus catalpae]SFE96314.1 ADP-ribose pyrophosphatase YjhB, NUDIX family [Paenibacillus catalpae]